MHVLGTAGHVDHGKSSLLRVLTGMEPSRLAEERRRGMTLQLGYVWLKDARGEPVGIVDVPGHADYRLATVAGASRIDAFLFICAADDGWMPQSEEHLQVLRAFGVTRGVVALTKVDLVTPERREAVKAELEVRFYEALGREVAVVPFAAPTREGEAELRAALEAELAALPPAEDRGRPLLPVDRVFSVTGQGTVVTGTLRGGTLTAKQRVEILPKGTKAALRTLQSYGAEVAVARPNARVALQIAGISVEDAPKDSQVAVAGALAATKAVDVRLEPLFAYDVKAKKTPEVLVVHGGVRTPATLIPIGAERSAAAGAGGIWLARLAFAAPRWLAFGERLVLTTPGGDRILASARVVDEAPVRGVKKALDRLPLVSDYTLDEWLAANLLKSGVVDARQVPRRTPFTAAVLADLLAADPSHVVLEHWITDAAHLDAWQDAVLARLAAFHAQNPAEEGMADTQLARRMGLAVEFLRIVLRQLKQAGKVTQVGPHLKLVGHVPKVDRTTETAQRLAAAAADATPVARSLHELGIDDEVKRKVLARFVADGQLVRLGEDHVMAAPAFATLSGQVRSALAGKGAATVAELRDALGLGRKLLVLVLEALDTRRVTVRDGDARRLAALP